MVNKRVKKADKGIKKVVEQVKKADKIVKRKRVTFALSAPGAKDVSLTGSFNAWDLKKHHMKLNGDGLWTKTVIIPPGTYEYKYFVGGEWWHDPANENVTYNEHGTLNSVITVK